MKQKLLLTLLALFTLGGSNLFAQSWTASEVGTGNFYLYNVGKGQFLTRGNGWGTQASVSANSAMTLILEEYNGAYKLRTNVQGDGKGLERLSDPVIYTDQSNGKNSTWTFTKVADASNGPVYTIVSAADHGGGSGSYMTANADNTIVGPADAVTDNYGKWQLLQSWITNSVPVHDANGWTVSQDPTFDGGNVCAEFWNKSGASIKQTVHNLPAGSYELIAVALTREGMTATLNAGSNTMSIVTVGTGTVNNRSQAKSWFDEGNGVNKLEFTLAGNTENLEIGLTADNTTGDHWLVWRSFVLIYKGLDLSELKAALQALIDAVPELEGTTTTAAYNAAKNYADAIVMDDLTTEEAISTASTELAALVNAAKALQASYSRYAAIRDAALAISEDVVLPDVESATTTEAIDAAIPTLRNNFLAELPNVTIPSDPGYIDVTDVMVDNAGVHTNTDYWTIANLSDPGWASSAGKCDYGECEFYSRNFKFYQTLALTPGTWEFGVTGFHRAGNHNTNFYAGEDKVLIPGVESSVVNSMSDAKTYFDNGNGKVALKFLIETAGDVEIGIDNQDTETDKWTIFRDFTLKYYGAPDYSVYESQWSDLVAEANTAKTNHANVTGTELTALNAAIADSPAGSNLKATYNEKINALQAALQTFNAAAPAYDKYVAYRAETVTLFGEEVAATVAAPTSAAEALVAVQNLNIAQYNKVETDYPYSLTSKIGDFSTWTGTATVGENAGTPNYFTNEHWSGTTHPYYEQDAEGWNNETGWTIKFEKKCTLPAGSYVIKVAARSSGTAVTSSMSCTATTTTVSLPQTGNRARGINTSGMASWSDNDEFANYDGNTFNTKVGGTGVGYEWRFLPFILTEETEVTMTFYAETTSRYQWMSIADGELLSADDIATAVAYDEAVTNIIEDVDVANVTITRKVVATDGVGYNTVCLPFDLTLGQVEAAFGTGSQVYAFSESSSDPMNATINFTKVDAGTITANTPVLVKATVASTSQTFEGVQVVAPTEDVKVEGANFDFVGTYAPITVDEGDYFISGGKLYKSEGKTNLKAFRAYIQAPDPEAKVNLFIDGVSTSISEINGAVKDENAVIYNIAGQRVNKAQKGVYIVNGKKVLVK